jgi:RNA polymerase sigma factor (sigma-70 family)
MGMASWPSEDDTLFEPKEKSIETRSFTELYDEYFDRINRYLRCRVNNMWDADDLTTVVFLKALEKFAQYDRRNSFAAWIFRIAQNTFIDFLRKKKEIPLDTGEWLSEDDDETWQPEKTLLNMEQIKHLHHQLGQLSQDQRDVLTLRYFGELKINQVAEVLGKTESSIKMISRRGLHKLHQLFEKEGKE